MAGLMVGPFLERRPSNFATWKSSFALRLSEPRVLQADVLYTVKIIWTSFFALRSSLFRLSQANISCRYPFSDNQPVQVIDWEAYITEIANDIVNEQSPKR
jgi:hypothetical protein